MLIIVETKAALITISEEVLKAIRESGYLVAEVDELIVDFVDGSEVCVITDEQINNGMTAVRQWLYTNVTDPMFFKAQRGEAEIKEWKEAVEKIKSDWSYDKYNAVK